MLAYKLGPVFGYKHNMTHMGVIKVASTTRFWSDSFLSNTMTGDEIWLNHFNPETQRKSMEWHHMMSAKKKSRTVPLARKVMESAFWDKEGCLIFC
jgi:hypothetical protein